MNNQTTETTAQNMQNFASSENENVNETAQSRSMLEDKLVPFDYDKYSEHDLIRGLPRMPKDDILVLADNIVDFGQLEPIEITPENKIINGRARFEACQARQVIPIFRIVDIEETSIISYWVNKNQQRAHWPSWLRAIIAVDLENYYKKLLQERKVIKLSKWRNGEPYTEEISASTTTRSLLAKAFFTNHKYINDASMLKKYDPELFEGVKNGTVESLDKAMTVLKSGNIEYILDTYFKLEIKALKEKDLVISDNEKDEIRKSNPGNFKEALRKLIDIKLDKKASEIVPLAYTTEDMKYSTELGHVEIDKDASKSQSRPKPRSRNIEKVNDVLETSDFGTVMAHENKEVITTDERTESGDDPDSNVYPYEKTEEFDEEELIKEFDSIDRNVKIKFIKEAKNHNMNPSDFLNTILYDIAA